MLPSRAAIVESSRRSMPAPGVSGSCRREASGRCSRATRRDVGGPQRSEVRPTDPGTIAVVDAAERGAGTGCAPRRLSRDAGRRRQSPAAASSVVSDRPSRPTAAASARRSARLAWSPRPTSLGAGMRDEAATIDRRAPTAFLAAVRARLPELRLLEDPADVEGYRRDWTPYLPAGHPAAVALRR